MEPASQSPFELLSGRRFAFYPALRNVEHNEWTLEEETWSEILAKNVQSGDALWIPRAHLGEISSVDEPVLIVGLKRELELKSGQIRPYRNPVVHMPGPKGIEHARPKTAAEEPPPPTRGDTDADSKTLAFIGRAVAIGVGALLLLVLFVSGNLPNPIAAIFRADTTTADQRYLGLGPQDGYFEIVEKLGQPSAERWLTEEEADLHFQVLQYANRRYAIILMGGERNGARYIGALHDPSHQILDSARMSGGRDTASMLKNLPDF